MNQPPNTVAFTWPRTGKEPLHAHVEKCGSGLYLYVDGYAQPIAKLDLFYALEQIDGPLGGQYPQVLVYDTQRDECVAFAALLPARTEVFFENGVECDSHTHADQEVHAYPLLEVSDAAENT